MFFISWWAEETWTCPAQTTKEQTKIQQEAKETTKWENYDLKIYNDLTDNIIYKYLKKVNFDKKLQANFACTDNSQIVASPIWEFIFCESVQITENSHNIINI